MQISELALRYETHSTKNISELERVEVTEEVNEFIGEDFSYYYIERDGTKYRVPKSVLSQLKGQLEDNPQIKAFKVKRSGEGLKTTYAVIPFA